PVLLRRIVSNLISNACHYTERGGILVAVRRRGGNHRIEVWDTGKGIALDQQRAIFEEFRQLDNPERNRTKGYGLGLSIVRKTAELLEHRLFLRSVAGRGSVFAVEVPQAEALAPLPETVSAGSVPSGKSAAILVIEDDPIQADTLGAIFLDIGYSVTIAHNLAEAIAPMTPPPDLVVSDYRLPGQLTGVEVVEHIRQTTGRSIPAVIMTGDTQADVAREAARARCTVVHKPYTLTVLMAAIDSVLSPVGGLSQVR
ncbi:MAG: ATP-binding protein, partial [Rhodospirillaceae bacterium]